MHLFHVRDDMNLEFVHTADQLCSILPGFLQQFRPDSAQTFTKMSSDDELGTLDLRGHNRYFTAVLHSSKMSVNKDMRGCKDCTTNL